MPDARFILFDYQACSTVIQIDCNLCNSWHIGPLFHPRALKPQIVPKPNSSYVYHSREAGT